MWCKKDRFKDKPEIEPAVVDGSDYHLLVFVSPVWAFKPTPAINTAIESLNG
jgi:hypothetical protein